MGMADAGGDDVVPASHFLIEVFGQIGLGPVDGSIEIIIVGSAEVQKIDGIVEDGLQIQADLAVLVHSGEGLQRHHQIIVELVDLLIQHEEAGDKGKLHMHDAGIGLDINVQHLTALCTSADQNLPVVHVSALDHLSVDKYQELGVFGIVPLVDLGGDVEKYRLSVHLPGDHDPAAEPVVFSGNAQKVRPLTLEFPVCRAVGIGIKPHGPAVKGLPGNGTFVCLLRAEELAVLHLPAVQLHTLGCPEVFQLVADFLNSFVNKIHGTFTPIHEKGQVSVRVPAKFEKSNGVVTFVFNYVKAQDGMMPAYMTVTAEETFASNMKGAGINTVMGVGIVFVTLIFLIFIISLFKYVNVIGDKIAKKEAPAAKPAASAAAPKAAPVVEEDLTDDLELVAVISAAIAASENTSTDSFVVRSIKKVNRNKWQRA